MMALPIPTIHTVQVDNHQVFRGTISFIPFYSILLHFI